MPTYLLKDPVYVKNVENIIDKIRVEHSDLAPDKLWDFTKTAIRGETNRYSSQCHKMKNIWTKDLDDNIKIIANARDRVSQNPELVRCYSEKLKLMQTERDELISHHSIRERQFNYARKHYELNRPTRYYFRIPGSKFDSIKRLENDDHTLVTDTKGILSKCHSFYSQLYNKKPHPLAQDEDLQWKFLQHIPPPIDLAKYVELDAPITVEELYKSLTLMRTGRSPGPDGLTCEFYLQFWDRIGKLVHDSLSISLHYGHLSFSQRRGLVRLIPKKGKDLLQVRNWRPITLLNVDYKLLSKSLALRLANVLPELIGKDQRGFVRNRYIGDNIYEIYSLIAQAEDSQEEGVLMLLDIEKAFDSVSWDFLYETLANFNLPDSFIQWVKILYAKKEIRLLNNGHASDSIFPSNGLAQGDGLSPLLFILVIETLALTIRANDAIEGFKVGSIHKKLGLLADDMILSLKAKQTTFDAVLHTLIDFAKVSNLAVNEHKSAVFAIGQEKTAPQNVDISPFKWNQDSHFTYLGIQVPVTSYRNNLGQHAIQTIIPHAESILRPRNTVDHVIMGRILNVKTFIESKLNYYFALAPLPNKASLTKAQSVLNKYIWSFGFHHVAARLIYRPYDAGGLNMYSLVLHNQTLKIKALNKLCCTTGEYWQEYIQSCLTIPCKLIPCVNLASKDIKHIVKPGVHLPVFWWQALKEWCTVNYCTPKDCSENTWLLCNSALSTTMVFRIEDMLDYQANGIVTIQDFIRIRIPKTLTKTLIARAISRTWPHKEFGVHSSYCDLSTPISVRALKKELLRTNTRVPHRVWFKWERDLQMVGLGILWPSICNIHTQFVSIKMRSFYWKFINRAIITKSRLMLWGSVQEDRCTFCQEQTETFFHVFWECHYTARLWHQLIQWCKLFIDPNTECSPQKCLLLGFPSVPLNNVMLVCKYYIHIQRHFKGVLSFSTLLKRINGLMSKDRNAFINLSYLNVRNFYRMWGNIPKEAFNHAK